MKSLWIRVLVLAILVLGLVAAPNARPAAAAGLCYVKSSAAGTNDGSSWANAYTDLQSALTNAGCTQVWAAAGVYYPTSGTDRTVSFVVNPGVAVYGGFAGTETLLAQRNPVAHVTILSGDIDRNDVNTDGNNIDETYTDIQGNNTFHVVDMDGTGGTTVTSSTVLDGFTITGGNATATNDAGGLFCNGNGGGHECSPTLSNLVFSGNYSQWGAGALDNYGSGGTSSPTVTNVTFTGNRSGNAGGAVVDDGRFGGTSAPRFTNVTFMGNSTSGGGGGMFNDGYFGNSSPTLISVTFSGNSANDGGGMVNNGPQGASIPILNFVTFSGNGAAVSGGAMYNSTGGTGNSSPDVGNSILWNNSAVSSGPEVFNDSATPSFIASDIQGSGGSGGSWDATLGSDGGMNIDADPLLAPLANNGGAELTMALIWGSPAVDAAYNFICLAGAPDERGVIRPQGPHCDMGAYERVYPNPPAHFTTTLASQLAVFRPSTGVWYVKNVFNTTWGTAGDVPVPADYGGAGYDGVAIWRPSTGIWYVKGAFNSAWGQAGDVPVPGDYDGNGTADVAVWRPSNGTWYVKGQFTTAWGQSGDIPVPADYNGNGVTDLAVFRPSTGTWYIKGIGNFAWGQSGDIPVPADYNGDGRVDMAVFRPSTGVWYVKGIGSFTWGTSTDIPVPGDFNGDGKADIAIFRPSTGQWIVKNQFTSTWGASGDFPLVAPDTNGDGTPYQ